MDVGAHRRKVYRTKPTIEDELWKRAFWYECFLDIEIFSANRSYLKGSRSSR